MKDPAFEELMERQIAAARERGVNKPVALVLSPHSTQAGNVYHELTGQSLPAADPYIDDETGLVHIVDSLAVQRALTAHAGPGGAAMAHYLADETLVVDHWYCVLSVVGIIFGAFRAGVVLLNGNIDYDDTRRVQTPGDLLNDEGPSACTTKLDDGRVVTIYGRNGVRVALAATLVGIVIERRWVLPHEGRTVAAPMNDDGLARLLKNVYSREPHIIAEAITALKKVGKQKWLLKVLWGRPELRTLAEAVRREQTGR